MIKKTRKKLLRGILLVTMILGISSMALGQGLGKFKPRKAYSENVFKDIKPNDWFYEDVTDVYKLELVSGKGNNIFAPLGEVTLAETIILATNIHSQYENKEIPQLSGKWYRSGVSYAIANGIIKEDDFKKLDSPATRAEVAYILSNSLPVEELKNINNIKEIPDVDSSTEFNESIFKLYNSGIIRGSGVDGKFNPDDNISRAEIAALINRFVQPEKRQKFGLGDVLYNNDKYGFSITIPRRWVGNYRVLEETTNDGKNYVNFYLVKNGENLIKIFNIEIMPESKFNYEENISRWNAGKNKGSMFLMDSSQDINDNLLKPENKKEKELYYKMIEEYNKQVRNSIKFK